MNFFFGLPFDAPERLYSFLSVIIAIIYLAVGSVETNEQHTLWHLRVIFIFAILYSLRLIIMNQMGISFSLHNDYKVFLLFIASFITCYILFHNTRELVKYKTDIQMMELKNSFMMENYNTLENYLTQIAQIKHEIYHHLFAIQQLSESNCQTQLLEYLSHIQNDYAKIDIPIACGNRIIQAILGHAAQRAKKLGFEIQFNILPFAQYEIPDADLVSIFMNLLDNALESCEKIQQSEDRWIQVNIKIRAPYLCISIINARQGELYKKKDAYITTKSDTQLHGQGIAVVQRIVEKLGGIVSFEHTDNTFTTEVALPID